MAFASAFRSGVARVSKSAVYPAVYVVWGAEMKSVSRGPEWRFASGCTSYVVCSIIQCARCVFGVSIIGQRLSALCARMERTIHLRLRMLSLC